MPRIDHVLPAPLWRRLAALAYDLLIVLALVMVVGMLAQLATGGELVADARDHVHIAWWYQPLQYLIIGAYFVFSWYRGGQTLGMRAWRLRLLGAEHNAPGIKPCVLRALVMSIPLLLPLVGHVVSMTVALSAPLVLWLLFYAAALFSHRRVTVQDYLSRTVIVTLPRT